METLDAVKGFEALAHEARLEIFRLLIPKGVDGLTAGVIAERVHLPANSLSFHLNRLVYAGFIRPRRAGRHIHYAVVYERLTDLVGFLIDDCCAAVPNGCLPECPSTAGAGSRACEPQIATLELARTKKKA